MVGQPSTGCSKCSKRDYETHQEPQLSLKYFFKYSVRYIMILAVESDVKTF